MVKTTAPSSRSRRRVDVREWMGGIRVSGFAFIMLGLVVLAACVLVPSVSTYLDQRAQISALEESVRVGQDEVDALSAEREQWRDPAFIMTQARERLYYVRPGEVVYLIDDDLPASAVPDDPAAVSSDVERTRTDWMSQFVRSVVTSGSARTAATGP
ncbi:FtsB family cell division protein [Microbacterium arborescens]|uniref:FtsB family cell division protein n=1 Tax=Microbacterium arborescens TaxID=33883 RepID=UPI0027813F8F|nr:septum formation initiator family protein [Microbacterium arborescens]MDQ1215985.1 cell division protein FtsB [Microbacterium arborescens]